MKKVIIIIGIMFLSFNIIVFGQSSQIEIRKTGTTENVAGQTLEYTITTSDVPISGGQFSLWEKAKFDVYNLSTKNIAFRIKRIRVDVPSDWLDNLCWPPLCYDNLLPKEQDGYYITPSTAGNPAPVIESNSINVVGGVADGSTAEIKPQIFPKKPGSVATYKYIVTDASGTTDIDSVILKISYIVDPNDNSSENTNSSINKVSSSNYELFLSPNPATDYVTVKAEGISEGVIRIVDVLGNIVYLENFDTVKKLNVSNYKHGIYFVSLQDSSAKTITKKLVVKN